MKDKKGREARTKNTNTHRKTKQWMERNVGLRRALISLSWAGMEGGKVRSALLHFFSSVLFYIFLFFLLHSSSTFLPVCLSCHVVSIGDQVCEREGRGNWYEIPDPATDRMSPVGEGYTTY